MTRSLRPPALSSLALAALLFAPGQHAAFNSAGAAPPTVRYTYVPLGTLGGANSMARGMNNLGHVVGFSESSPCGVAFLYTPDTGMVDLNSLIPSGSGAFLEVANEINDAGQIVGQFGEWDDNLDGVVDRAGIAWRYTPASGNSPAVVEELQMSEGDNPRPWGINAQGDVVGNSVIDGAWHLVVWTGSAVNGVVPRYDLGRLTPTNTLVQYTAITDRDANGIVRVLGSEEVYGTSCYGDFDTNNPTAPVVLVPFGAPYSSGVRAYDMNNNGTITGDYEIVVNPRNTTRHAFEYSDGAGLIDLGAFNKGWSYSYGINDQNWAVGYAGYKSKSKIIEAASIYVPGSGLNWLEPLITNLPPNMAGVLRPWRINNANQICGPYTDNFNFTGVAFLLTPTAP